MNKNKKRDIKSKMIKRQADKIDLLEKQINDLNISCEEKDGLVRSVEDVMQELNNIIAGVKAKGNEYDKLIQDLLNMRKIMNVEVFKGRWKIIKFLMK